MNTVSNVVSIKSYAEKNPVLIINSKKAYDLGLNSKKRAYVSFGVFKNFVDIVVSDEASTDDILLTQIVMDNLHLPDYPSYEVFIKGNEITIGPCIGMLISDEDKNITASRLQKMLLFTREYYKLHGAIIIFALDQIDTSNRCVTGYCYNPEKDSWQRGKFPYPSSIYRTIGLSDFWKNHFLSILGDKFFNNHYFNKWDMYRWFSTDPDMKQHLPFTILYQSTQDIHGMLNKYGKIFIKPVSGLKGNGIIKATMEGGSIVFRYRENQENQNVAFDKPNAINQFIENRFHPGRYLIQQAIDLLKHEGSVIDFRCALQKDQSSNWVCNAVLGRYGDKDSVVSNISNGGTTYEVVDLLKKVHTSPGMDILAMKNRMEYFAIKVANTLDEYGINCGTLGLDVGIDADGHLWLIEINNRDPSPRYALDIDDKLLYNIIKTSPLLYAKALAGFGK